MSLTTFGRLFQCITAQLGEHDRENQFSPAKANRTTALTALMTALRQSGAGVDGTDDFLEQRRHGISGYTSIHGAVIRPAEAKLTDFSSAPP